MKTNMKISTKDNFFAAAVLASLFLFIASIAAVANSKTVSADAVAATQQLAGIVVTAHRLPIATMDIIVVSGSRHADQLPAAK